MNRVGVEPTSEQTITARIDAVRAQPGAPRSAVLLAKLAAGALQHEADDDTDRRFYRGLALAYSCGAELVSAMAAAAELVAEGTTAGPAAVSPVSTADVIDRVRRIAADLSFALGNDAANRQRVCERTLADLRELVAEVQPW